MISPSVIVFNTLDNISIIPVQPWKPIQSTERLPRKAKGKHLIVCISVSLP